MIYMIDAPSPFASDKEWRDFLTGMRAIENPDANVIYHIDLAVRELRRRAEESAIDR